MTLHDDRTFMRHFSWVLIGLLGMTILFIFLAFLIVGVTGVDSHRGYSYESYVKQHPAAVPARPAAKVTTTAAATAAVASAATASTPSAGHAQGAAAASSPGGGNAPTGAVAATGGASSAGGGHKLDGHAIWEAHCAVCHQTGVANAPKIGDKSEWAPILSGASLKTIFSRDIHGYTGKRGTMPAKGGNPSLSDAQVIAAAKYMIGRSGGHPGS